MASEGKWVLGEFDPESNTWSWVSGPGQECGSGWSLQEANRYNTQVEAFKADFADCWVAMPLAAAEAIAIRWGEVLPEPEPEGWVVGEYDTQRRSWVWLAYCDGERCAVDDPENAAVFTVNGKAHAKKQGYQRVVPLKLAKNIADWFGFWDGALGDNDDE